MYFLKWIDLAELLHIFDQLLLCKYCYKKTTINLLKEEDTYINVRSERFPVLLLSQISSSWRTWWTILLLGKLKPPKLNPKKKKKPHTFSIGVFSLRLPSSPLLPLIDHWQNMGDVCFITSLTAFLLLQGNEGCERGDPQPRLLFSICFFYPVSIWIIKFAFPFVLLQYTGKVSLLFICCRSIDV